MTKGLKLGIGVTVLCCAVLSVAYIHFSGTWTDRFGFTHNVENDTTYAVDENASRAFAIVKGDKSLIDASDREFISTVTPILNAYQGKMYTTIVFDDGTGIYFPFSDSKQTAFYGTVDEDGNIVNEISKFTIAGTEVIRGESSAARSEDSAKFREYYPDAYQNDDSWTAVKDNCLFLSISAPVGDRAVDCEAKANEFFNAYVATGAPVSELSKVYISVGDIYFYSIENGVAVQDNSLEEQFEEIYR